MAYTSFRLVPYAKNYLVGLPFDGYTQDYLNIEQASSGSGSIAQTTSTYSIAYDGTETSIQSVDITFKSTSALYSDVSGYLILPPTETGTLYTFSNITSDFYNLKSSDIKDSLPLYSKSYATSLVGRRVTLKFYPKTVFNWLNNTYPDRTGTAFIYVVFGNASYTPTTEHTINYTTVENCSFTVAPETYTEGETLSLRVVANTGYHFDTAPYIKYTNTSGATVTSNLSQLTSNTTYIYGSAISNIASDSAINVYASAVVDVTYYSYTETLTNCTSDFTESTIAEGKHTITLTAASGYWFESEPTCTGGTGTFTISSDKLTCTCVIDVTGDFALTASCELIKYSFAQTLTNCTSDFTSTEVTAGAYTITLTANTGYQFDETPTFTGGTMTAVASTDKQTVVCSCTVTGAATLTASAVETPKEVYTVTVQSSTGATVEAPTSYTEGDTLTITATVQDGYYWDKTNPPYIRFTTVYGETIESSFTISDTDETIATYNKAVTYIKSGTIIYIIANGTPKTTYIDKYGTIYIYNVTIDNLQQFANQRFYIYSSDYTYTVIDYGDYVCALFKVYCDIGETGDSTLKVLNKDLGIAVKVPYNDTITVDCGAVTVSPVNNSATDYIGNVRLMLPFIGFQTLDASKIVGHETHLYYKINIVTGEAVAFVEIDGTIEQMFDCNASQKILYLSETNKQVSDYEFKSKWLYGFTPYALFEYHLGENNAPTSAISLRKQVKACKGYFNMTDCTAMDTTNMNETERNKIIETLASGCFYGGEYDDETILGT